MKLLAIITAFALPFIAGYTFISNWNADATKSSVKFEIKGPFGKVHGSFSGLKATIVFDEKDLSGSSITASIDAKTVNTGIGLRNSDLRKKEEWLNTDKYPAISFHSRKILKTANGYTASGELTMKGITKPVDIPFTFTNKDKSGLFKGSFTINRRDFGIGKEGGSVGSTINLMLEVPVNKK